MNRAFALMAALCALAIPCAANAQTQAVATVSAKLTAPVAAITITAQNGELGSLGIPVTGEDCLYVISGSTVFRQDGNDGGAPPPSCVAGAFDQCLASEQAVAIPDIAARITPQAVAGSNVVLGTLTVAASF